MELSEEEIKNWRAFREETQRMSEMAKKSKRRGDADNLLIFIKSHFPNGFFTYQELQNISKMPRLKFHLSQLRKEGKIIKHNRYYWRINDIGKS